MDMFWLAVGCSLFGALAYGVGFWRGRKSLIEEFQALVLEFVAGNFLLEDEQKSVRILSGDEDGLKDLDDVELEVPQQQSKENDGSTSDQT
jgi:hypothetical protein